MSSPAKRVKLSLQVVTHTGLVVGAAFLSGILARRRCLKSASGRTKPMSTETDTGSDFGLTTLAGPGRLAEEGRKAAS